MSDSHNAVAKVVSLAPSNIWMRRLLGFPVLLGAILVAGVFATTLKRDASGTAFREGDTWWHLAAGQAILSTHRLPHSDPYSFTASGQNWVAYEWLGDITMAAAERAAGLAGIAFLLFVFAASIMLLTCYLAYLRSGNWQAAFLTSAAFLVVGVYFFTLRPQLMGYTLLLIELICLERFRAGKQQQLWALPLIFLLWVNLHGSFVLGLFCLAVFVVSGFINIRQGGICSDLWTRAQRGHLAWIVPLSLSALFVTPYGSQLVFYPLRVAFRQPLNIANIQEWMPLPFDLMVGKLILGAVLVFIIALIILRPVFRLDEIALFVPVLFASIIHRRIALFLMILFVPMLAKVAAEFLPSYRPEIDKHWLNLVLMALMVFGAVRLSANNESLSKALSEKFPVRAVNYLRAHPVNSPMYNEYGWGGYLIWAYPEKKVFIDGRTDIYENSGVFSDYLSISRLAPGTLDLLRKYGIGMCVLERSSPLGTLLQALPDWRLTYEDDLSSVYVHK